jgi:phospholipid-binding lipoprotein MlaA
MKNNVGHGHGSVLLALGIVGLISGCATTHSANSGENGNNDPIEGANRVFYDFNDGLDRYIVKPAAETYVDYTPRVVRSGVKNFFENLTYLNVIVNNFLQGKVSDGFTDMGRFMVNSTLGMGGLMDPASEMGLRRHNEDLGQTLGTWGAGEGAYLVIPFRGPSSVRDVPDLPASTFLNPLFYISSTYLFPVGIIGIINERANVLEATRVRDEAALDPYSFTRAAYREKRIFDIYDGNPPSEGLDAFIEEE